MRHRPRHFRQAASLALACSAALLAGGAQAGVTAEAVTSKGATITVTATNLRNEKGVVRACITSTAKGFPDCKRASRAHSASVPAAGHVTLTFHDVTPGRYAIALLHDENANGKADRALGMMPKEGFGFSRNAKLRMGPPRFEDAAFTVGSADQRQAIRMRYLF